MRVLIVDDEPPARQRLARLLADADCQLVGEAANGEQALRESAALQPDVVLLDIQMPGENGIAVARQLARQQPAPAVIFCTAYDDYAVAAFEAAAIDYLLKPVEAHRLREALLRARSLNRAQLADLEALATPEKNAHRRLLSRTARGVESVAVEQICYFHAEQKYVTAVYPGGELLLNESLRQLEEEFGEQLLRVHRNALVAVRHLRGLERAGIGQYRALLNGIERGPLISRRHLPEVRRRLENL